MKSFVLNLKKTKGWRISVIYSSIALLPIILTLILCEINSNLTSISLWLWISFPVFAYILSTSLTIILTTSSKSPSDIILKKLKFLNDIIEKYFGSYINNGLESIVEAVADGRANVMLIDKNVEPQVLKIEYKFNMDGVSDETLTWEKREGCCGRAWASGRTLKADLSKVDTVDLGNNWQMDKMKIACTSNIKSIISVPIRNMGKDIIGVLNCDSSQNLDSSGLDSDINVQKVENVASMIATFVDMIRLSGDHK